MPSEPTQRDARDAELAALREAEREASKALCGAFDLAISAAVWGTTEERPASVPAGDVAIHDFYDTGTGFSYGFNGGANNVQCCRCGIVSTQRYHLTRTRMEGHGPHVTAETIEYDPITDAPTCPAAPGRPTGETET